MPSACPSCGRSLPASARRCPHCGADAASPVRLGTPRPAELPPPAAPARAAPARPTAEVLVEGARSGVRGGARLVRRIPRRARFVLAGVLAALVIGVPATLWVVGKVAYAAEEPVEDLVAALNDRDIARAAALAGCGSRLCRADALSEGYRPPTGVSIAEVAMGGSSNPDTADVRVTYDLAGQRRESIVRVRRGPGLFLREWAIVSGATAYLEVVAPSVKTVRVAAQDIAVPAAGGRTGRDLALIGSYTVRVADDPLYEGEPVEVALTGDLRSRPVTSVDVRPTVKPGARDEVVVQVKAFVDRCAQQPEEKPKVDGHDCPFAFSDIFFPPRSENKAWRVLEPPVFEVVPPAKPGGDVILVVRTTKTGKAELTYTAGGDVRTRQEDIDVKGEVHLENGALRFTPG